ncbi:hypothetical protein BJY01DRAFT_122693 [Aspergillus pseudoustus]|uniref:Uncharacterized protein n=1 Tax=Aspergillus pseudoustus TaxID=1810923 RepID=A0ABR4IQ20_9EURO
MDLSSLEGPPMVDGRFSSPVPSTHSVVPHIHLEDIQSPVSPLESNSWNLPPRPASTSAIPPRHKYANMTSNGFWQSMHPESSSSSSNRVTSAPRSLQAQSSSYTASYRPSTPTNSNIHINATLSAATTSTSSSSLLSTSQPTRSTSRPYSSSISNPHQLVWVESEQIWILTTRTTPPSTLAPGHYHGRSRSSSGRVLNSSFVTGPSYTSTLSHSRSMELYPSASTSITEFWGNANEPEDLPPPYEQHIFDQPLGPIMPAVRRVPREEVQQIRGSRWAAIGRRVT